MRSIAIAASVLASVCACGGVRSSNIEVGWGEQPVWPLHVHPSLSGTPALADARAPGRGTRGAPTSPPFVVYDYPDPPEFAIVLPNEPQAVATPQPDEGERRSRRRGR